MLLLQCILLYIYLFIDIYTLHIYIYIYVMYIYIYIYACYIHTQIYTFKFLKHAFFYFTFSCNWWFRLITTKSKWTESFHRNVAIPVHRIWMFYYVFHALPLSKCLQICGFQMFVCTTSIGIKRKLLLDFLFSLRLFHIETRNSSSLPEYKSVSKNNFDLSNLLNESAGVPIPSNRCILLRRRFFEIE